MVTTFLFFLVSLLIFVTAESQILVNITILQSAVAKGAVCLDGTPPAYHLDRGSGTGVNNWMISIEGGGWCRNVTLCLERKNTRRGSSAKMDQQVTFSGMKSNDPKSNPEFYNWNRVFVRYCDGGSFTGDVEEIDPGTGLHYRGARIFKVIMEDLLAQGMNTSENAILSGCSAGGLTTILHCDNFRTYLPKSAKVKCFSDAGYFVDLLMCIFPARIFQGKHILNSSTTMLSLYMAPPKICLHHVLQNWNQVRNILVTPGTDPKGAWKSCRANIKNCTPDQLKVLQDFRLDFLKALEGLGPSSTRGYYINSCFSHCQTLEQAYWFGPNSPTLFNKTIAEAVGDWFLDRDQFQQIDCPYPCDKTCVDDSDIISSQNI